MPNFPQCKNFAIRGKTNRLSEMFNTRNIKSVQGTHVQGRGTHKGAERSYNKVKVKLFLGLNNYALRHEDVWGSGCIDPRFVDLGLVGGEWSASRPGRFTAGKGHPVPIG
jgi:hypothetical protein